MKKKFVSLAVVSFMVIMCMTACKGISLSGIADSGSSSETQENSEKRKNAASDLILEGHEIDHPVYGKLIVSGDLWAVCEDVEKETEGEITAEKAAWILYYEEEDSHGTEAESALEEAREGLYGENKEDFLSYIRDSLEMLETQ